MHISIFISGGLGNQMFQYAFGLALTTHYNATLSMRWVRNRRRNYSLENIFGIPYLPHRRRLRYKRISQGRYTPFTPGDERQHFNWSPDNYMVGGHWQNYACFKDYENVVRKAYALEPIKLPEDSVLVHVRRTDFVRNRRFFYCDEDWYRTAFTLMPTNELFFISDDIKWCKQTFGGMEGSLHFIDKDEKTCLQYMYGASRLIIPNSTFAWWGAYMSGSNEVICPGIWLPGTPDREVSKPEWQKLYSPNHQNLIDSAKNRRRRRRECRKCLEEVDIKEPVPQQKDSFGEYHEDTSKG